MSYLTEDQKAQLSLQHKKERDGRARIGLKQFFMKGRSIQVIAEALLLSDNATRLHLNEYATV